MEIRIMDMTIKELDNLYAKINALERTVQQTKWLVHTTFRILNEHVNGDLSIADQHSLLKKEEACTNLAQEK